MGKSKTISEWVVSQVFAIVIVFVTWFYSPDVFYVYIMIAVFLPAGIYELIKIIALQKSTAKEEASPEDKPADIEWNAKNLLLLGGALLFAAGAVFYGLDTADEQLAQKRQKMMAMPLSMVANHIIKHNSGRRLDPATKIDRIAYEEPVLTFYYQIQSGLLEKAASFRESLKQFKSRVTREFRIEHCTKTAFSVFLEKGGAMHYVYHKIKDSSREYLFDINMTKEACNR